MYRRIMTGVLLASALSLAGVSVRGGEPESGDQGHLDHCAKTCLDCLYQCESCCHHAAALQADGKKEIADVTRLTVDCGELCATTGKFAARHSPLAVVSMGACANGCDACADACEKAGTDEHMKSCAQACRDCAKVCRAFSGK